MHLMSEVGRRRKRGGGSYNVAYIRRKCCVFDGRFCCVATHIVAVLVGPCTEAAGPATDSGDIKRQ